MSPNLRIAYRFLTAKKRAMFMSLSCTVLGVGLFIVTQATTSGFEEFFTKTILGISGAIRVQDKIQDTMQSMAATAESDFYFSNREGVKYIDGVEEPDRIMAALREFENVKGVSAVLRGNAVLTNSFTTKDAQVFGIKLEDHIQVSDLARQIANGKLDDFRDTPSGALVGRVLADHMRLSVGDSFVITYRGQTRTARLSAIYETGISDIDKVNVYLHMPAARSLMKRSSGATFIQVNVHDPKRAKLDAPRMEEVLHHRAEHWEWRERSWLEVFRALRISTMITVSVFTLIASLAMFNTLAMIVMEKTKDIAILRSMGYERKDITQIFLWQAGIVLAIGSALGVLFGYSVTWIVEQVPLQITGIFKADHVLVVRDVDHYIAAIATAVVMVMIASLIPARRAARLEPGDIVRGTAQ